MKSILRSAFYFIQSKQEKAMKKEISNETIEYIGILSKLEINQEEKKQASSDLKKMLNFFDKMNELDTDGVKPMSHPVCNTNVFRDDIVTNGDTSVEILRNAPMVSEGMFSVPRTFD